MLTEPVIGVERSEIVTASVTIETLRSSLAWPYGTMRRLRIALLGSPVVDIDGAPLVVDTRMAVALLAYLADHPESQSRDTLATLLWPEYEHENARANLRRTLSALKRGLGGPWLRAERNRIVLERSPEVTIDVDDLAAVLRSTIAHGHSAADVCPACIEPLNDAAGLLRGPFLSGFTLRESPAFDDWQAQEAAVYQRQFVDVIDRLTRGLACRGDFSVGIPLATRWVATDPLDESAQRRLMLLLAWAGQRSAALRQYRDCERVLDRELGVAPSPETSELAEQIQGRREPAPFTFATRAPTPVWIPAAQTPLSPPSTLVGRHEEWIAMTDAYTGIGQNPAVLTIHGEWGVGKTRLVQEFLAYVRARGGRTLSLRCSPGESQLAYASLAEALRASLDVEDARARIRSVPAQVLAEAARLLPELSVEGIQAADGPATEERFRGALVQLTLTLLDGASPPALLVDDAHWADDATLALVSRLAKAAGRRALCVLFTYLPGEPGVDHRLARLFVELQRDTRLVDLPLTRLSPRDTEQLATALSPDLTADRLNEVIRRTEGLPYFVVEYVRALADAGSTDALPEGVHTLLESRVARLPEIARQILGAAAVLGRSFDFDMLHAVSGAGEDTVAASLEQLVERDLVREVAGHAMQFDFASAWLRELVYGHMSSTRRRLLHRRAAESLSRSNPNDAPSPAAAQIALHYEAAGADARAADFFFQAATHARRIYATREALEHFQRALALGHPATAALHEAIGDLQTLLGAYADAETSFYRAAPLCARSELPRLEHKLANLYCRRGDWAAADKHFASAEAELDERQDDAERARVYADWSLAFARRGELEHGTQLAGRALQAAIRADEAGPLIAAHNAHGILALRRGEPEESCVHHQRSLALAEAVDDVQARIAALNNLALARLAAGDSRAALGASTAALDLCLTVGDRHRAAALHNNLADVLRACGRPDEAMTHLKQAAALFAEIGSGGEDFEPEIWMLTEW